MRIDAGRVGAFVWGSAAVAGLVVVLTPELPKRPLLGRDEWHVEGDFRRDQAPSPGEVSPELSRDPQDYWRSVGCGAHPCAVYSKPFSPPRYLAVPIIGYPGRRGVDLFLECVATGARLPVARGNVHETWTERTLRIPGPWCGSDVRLVAADRSPLTTVWVGVGVPHESSALAWLKESSVVAVAIHAIVLLLLVAPGAALMSLVPATLLLGLPRSLLYVPLTLVLGFAGFFGVYYGGRAGQAILLGVVIALLAVAGLRRRRIVGSVVADGSSRPLRVFFLLSLGFVLLLYSADDGLGTWAATYRFDPAAWSSDNQIPQFVAEGLVHGRPARGMFGGSPWHVSDRPPLMTGAFLLQRPLWEAVVAIGGNRRFLYLFYQIAGIVLCAWWVVPVWHAARSVEPPSDRSAARVVGLVATTGFATFNSIYIWPKMLAGALGLAAFLVLEQARREEGTWRPREAATAGLLAGLALMSHGGVAFGLAPVFAATLLPRPKRGLRTLLLSAVAAVVVVLPWSYWQRTEDPPGNALVKFALAGTYGWDDESRGVLETVAMAYREGGWRGWLDGRVEAAKTLVGGGAPDLVAWLWDRDRDLAGTARLMEFLFVLPALGWANVGWLVLVVGRRLRSAPGDRSPPAACVRCLVLGASGLLVNFLVNRSLHITHHQSYLALLLLFVGLYGVILSARAWLRAPVVAIQLAYYAIVWVLTPLGPARLRPDSFLGFLAVSAVLGVGLWRVSRVTEPAW
jgi:hypothetical protein